MTASAYPVPPTANLAGLAPVYRTMTFAVKHACLVSIFHRQRVSVCHAVLVHIFAHFRPSSNVCLHITRKMEFAFLAPSIAQAVHLLVIALGAKMAII